MGSGHCMERLRGGGSVCRYWCGNVCALYGCVNGRICAPLMVRVRGCVLRFFSRQQNIYALYLSSTHTRTRAISPRALTPPRSPRAFVRVRVIFVFRTTPWIGCSPYSPTSTTYRSRCGQMFFSFAFLLKTRTPIKKSYCVACLVFFPSNRLLTTETCFFSNRVIVV